MCIYYPAREDLTYKSREHIFPAGIGGIEMLDSGVVSDQANKYFSKLEFDMMLCSEVSISRTFLGPGKRGSNKPGNLRISAMQGSKTDEFSLGYVFNGSPYSIPHVLYQKNQLHFHTDNKLGVESIKKFIESLNNFNFDKYCLIGNPKIPPEQILIGFYNNKYFIGSSKKKEELDLEEIRKIIQFITDKVKDINNPKSGTEQVTCNSQIITSIDTARVFAKIAFNVLAKFKGHDYLLNSAFDDMRQWIIGEKELNINWIPDGKRLLEAHPFPKDCHKCFIIDYKGSICAIVSLYDYWTRAFQLGDVFDNSFKGIPISYICDWRNKKEYTLIEMLNKIDRDNENMRLIKGYRYDK